MFDENDIQTLILRYLWETYNISDNDIITAVITINKNLPSFDKDRVVYVNTDDLHTKIKALPPVSFKLPDGKIITEADVNNEEYRKNFAKEFINDIYRKNPEEWYYDL